MSCGCQPPTVCRALSGSCSCQQSVPGAVVAGAHAQGPHCIVSALPLTPGSTCHLCMVPYSLSAARGVGSTRCCYKSHVTIIRGCTVHLGLTWVSLSLKRHEKVWVECCVRAVCVGVCFSTVELLNACSTSEVVNTVEAVTPAGTSVAATAVCETAGCMLRGTLESHMDAC